MTNEQMRIRPSFLLQGFYSLSSLVTGRDLIIIAIALTRKRFKINVTFKSVSQQTENFEKPLTT
jgi:hypothetical protein